MHDFPYKWQTAPFNNDWASSFFASQDPVAIDSVGFDFLYNEWPEAAGPGGDGADDYLHEAASIPNPPSGYTYDPNHDGRLTASLGVHEHWNNATDKQYTRNLGTGKGIELVTAASAGWPDTSTGEMAVRRWLSWKAEISRTSSGGRWNRRGISQHGSPRPRKGWERTWPTGRPRAPWKVWIGCASCPRTGRGRSASRR